MLGAAASWTSWRSSPSGARSRHDSREAPGGPAGKDEDEYISESTEEVPALRGEPLTKGVRMWTPSQFPLVLTLCKDLKSGEFLPEEVQVERLGYGRTRAVYSMPSTGPYSQYGGILVVAKQTGLQPANCGRFGVFLANEGLAVLETNTQNLEPADLPFFPQELTWAEHPEVSPLWMLKAAVSFS